MALPNNLDPESLAEYHRQKLEARKSGKVIARTRAQIRATKINFVFLQLKGTLGLSARLKHEIKILGISDPVIEAHLRIIATNTAEIISLLRENITAKSSDTCK
jgi:hypothetical protein